MQPRRAEGSSRREPGARRGPPRADRGQRLPALRALAHLVETGWTSAEGGTRAARPVAAEIGTPGERPRGGQPARSPASTPATRDMLELAATVGAEYRARAHRRARGAGDGDRRRARRGRAQRHDRGAPSDATRLPVHPRARPARALRPLTALRRAELHLRGGPGAGGGPGTGRAGSSPSSRITSRRPPHRTTATGPSSTTSRPPRRRPARWTSARRSSGCETRSCSGIDDECRARRGAGLAGHASRPRREVVRRSLAAFREAAEIARGLGDAELLARAAIGFEDALLAAGHARRGRRGDARGGGGGARRRRLGAARGAAGRPRARARHASGDHERAAVVRDERGPRWPARQLDDRRGPRERADALLLVARSTPASRRSWRCSTEARELGGSWATPRSGPRRSPWRIPTFVAMGDLESAERGRCAVLETAERTAQPFMLHVAEHYALGPVACDGRLEEAEAAARALTRMGRLC